MGTSHICLQTVHSYVAAAAGARSAALRLREVAFGLNSLGPSWQATRSLLAAFQTHSRKKVGRSDAIESNSKPARGGLEADHAQIAGH